MQFVKFRLNFVYVLFVALDEGCLLRMEQVVNLRLQIIAETVQLRQGCNYLQQGVLNGRRNTR
jgi:hypothetical protein